MIVGAPRAHVAGGGSVLLVYESQATYRALYDALRTPSDGDVVATVIQPWIDANRDERRWLAEVARTESSPQGAWPALGAEDLARLYALSRVLELLLHGRPQMEVAAVGELTQALGMRLVHVASFDPILHEITGVEQVAGAPTTITDRAWPALMLGALVIQRGGVVVRADAGEIDAEVATRSTLYWAHKRRTRPVTDQSAGWGSSSQWRTRFRRDYLLGDMRVFNVDGSLDVRTPTTDLDREALSVEQRIELLVHRCFVRTRLADDELTPWQERYAISESAR